MVHTIYMLSTNLGTSKEKSCQEILNATVTIQFYGGESGEKHRISAFHNVFFLKCCTQRAHNISSEIVQMHQCIQPRPEIGLPTVVVHLATNGIRLTTVHSDASRQDRKYDLHLQWRISPRLQIGLQRYILDPIIQNIG